jgi:quinohemoprotein ethanol dehydrogenase
MKTSCPHLRVLCVVFVAAAACAPLAFLSACKGRAAAAASHGSGDVNEQRVLAQAPAGNDWLVPGENFDETHFSPLHDITSQNVGSLSLAWSLDLHNAMGMAAEPIEVDGVIYVSEPLSIVDAVNAATGKLIWRYDPQVERGVSTQNSYAVRVNRGVAVWQGKVYVSTGDCRLFAIDAASGQKLWDAQICNPEWTGSTGAPHVARGKVFIGYNGSDDESRGSLVAFDAQTGKQAYRFWTVPGNPADGPESPALEKVLNTWQGTDYWKVGGGDAWDAITYDPQTNYILFGTAGAHGGEGDMPDKTPAGAKLYSGSIIAIDADSGKLAWYYQTSGKYLQTENFHIVLADLTIHGQNRRVAMTAPKNGFFYVLDARTGKLINGGPLVQTRWASSLDLATGRPVETSPENANRDSQVEDSLEVGDVVIQPPSASGHRSLQWTVHNWWPMSYSPQTGLVYIPLTDMRPDAHASTGRRGLRGDFFGRLEAWDPIANQARWSVVEPIATNGAVLSTAGNLIFQGQGTGEFAAYAADSGKKLWSIMTGSAIDSVPISYRVAGEQYILIPVGWGSASRIFGPASAMATPQSERGPSRLLAFKLNGNVPFPTPPDMVPEIPAPPEQHVDQAVIEEGHKLYNNHLCAGCHSPGLDGSGAWVDSGNGNDGAIPDLRYMPAGVHRQWDAIVLGGTHAKQGMLGFGIKQLQYPPVSKLTVEQSHAIHAYVIDESWKAYNAQHAKEEKHTGQ